MAIREFDRIDILAYLRQEKIPTLGYVLKGRKVYFQYEDSPELEKIVLSFLNNTLQINPQDYNYHMRAVIRLIKEIQKGVDGNGR